MAVLTANGKNIVVVHDRANYLSQVRYYSAEKSSTPMTVQTLIFSKDKFSRVEAVAWARKHKFNAGTVNETGTSFRLRQKDPSEFDDTSMRTITLTAGIQAVVGKRDSGDSKSKKKCGHMNEDGTFKGGFDGCVVHMQAECGGGHSKESATRICGSIAANKDFDPALASNALDIHKLSYSKSWHDYDSAKSHAAGMGAINDELSDDPMVENDDSFEVEKNPFDGFKPESMISADLTPGVKCLAGEAKCGSFMRKSASFLLLPPKLVTPYDGDWPTYAGGEMKKVGDRKYAGYLVRFTGPDKKDCDGEYFDKETDFMLGVFPIEGIKTLYQHGLDSSIGSVPLGQIVKVEKRDDGIFVVQEYDFLKYYKQYLSGLQAPDEWKRRQEQLASKYDVIIQQMLDSGELGWSSGAHRPAIHKSANGHIDRWPIWEATNTPTPCMPFETKIQPVKSIRISALTLKRR